MPTKSAVAELLTALSRELKRQKVPWYIFGAQAAILWGVPRTTADVDVTVQLAAADARNLILGLKRAGFDVADAAVAKQFATLRVLPLIHRASGIAVDLIAANSDLELQMLERAVPLKVGRASLPVVAPEDLVLMKVLAARPKDLEDVRALLVRAPVDVDVVRSRLEELEALLDRNDLVRLLTSLSAASRRK